MLLKLKDIVKNYGDDDNITPAVCGVSFEVDSGEFVALMGASGSGKSTLMHIIGFLDKSTSGKYFFNDEDASKFDDDKLAEIRNQKIGFVFQMYNLLPRATLLENVLLPTVYAPRQDRKKSIKKAKEILTKMGLEHRLSHHPNQLSGGEQQRAAIARALMNNPKLILADEPTGNLDSKSGQEVIEVLQELNGQGHTIVMVTHESDIAQCAERIIEMRDGKIIRDEKIKQKNASEGLVK